MTLPPHRQHLYDTAAACGFPRVTLDRQTAGGQRDYIGPGSTAYYLGCAQAWSLTDADVADAQAKLDGIIAVARRANPAIDAQRSLA